VITDTPHTTPEALVAAATMVASDGHDPLASTGVEEEISLCQATTRAGAPCKNRALPGQTLCRAHQNRKAPEILE
jgi:hypothetical protein